jgi:hypothetical protein
MFGVQQPIEIARAPPSLKVDPDIERASDAPDHGKRQAIEVAAFDSRDGRWRHSSEGSQVALA